MKTSIDLIAPASAATAERPYVVLKRGLFWRPKDRGYTYNIAEAGRYTREEAEARCHPDNEPVTMELASKYESVPTLADRELAIAIIEAVAKWANETIPVSDEIFREETTALCLPLIAAHVAAATAKERQARESRLLNIARGCLDYGGGYRGDPMMGAFHHGIETVIRALEAAMKNNPNDTQVNALERIGSALAPAPAGGKPAP